MRFFATDTILALLAAAVFLPSVVHGESDIMNDQLVIAQTNWNKIFGNIVQLKGFALKQTIEDDDDRNSVLQTLTDLSKAWVLDDNTLTNLVGLDEEIVATFNSKVDELVQIGQEVFELTWESSDTSFSTMAVGTSEEGIKYDSLLSSVILTHEELDGGSTRKLLASNESGRQLVQGEETTWTDIVSGQIASAKWEVSCVNQPDGSCTCEHICEATIKTGVAAIKCDVQ